MSKFTESQNQQVDDYVNINSDTVNNINNGDNINNTDNAMENDQMNDPMNEGPKTNMSINMNEIKISEHNKKRTKIEGLKSIGSVTKYLSQTKVEFEQNNEETILTDTNNRTILRNEYLKIMEKNDATKSMEIIKDIYLKAIDNAKSMLIDEEDKEYGEYYISIRENNEKKYYTIKNGEFIIVGRIDGCNYKSECTCVSRIHAIILNYMDTIYVFDSYSRNGIEILNGSNKDEYNNRQKPVLRFNKNEIGNFLIAYEVEVNFTQKNCIICLSKVREIIFSCNHTVMCRECYVTNRNNIKECMLCKKPIINVISNKDPCFDTFVVEI